jgi:gamma-glutamyltranspeptidase/glutathione hydrolase
MAGHMDLAHYPYATERVAVVARNGVVATSQALASQAGLAVLRRGGNAVDAALATAITLTVVEPTSNGIGGDLFALVWDGSQLHGLNGSGRAPAALTTQRVRDAGHETMPSRGWLTVTVPGAPQGWRDLHDRWGKLPFEAIFEDAIGYAEGGFPLSPTLAQGWHAGVEADKALIGPEFAAWQPTFAPDGFQARPGAMWASPAHARTLRAIAASGAEDFYRGPLAQAIADFAAATNGTLTMADLAQHSSTWVEPITTNYRGYDVWEIPPSGQGLTALLALNILEGFDFTRYQRDSAETFHLQIEALKLAFADAFTYIADPANDQQAAETLWKALLDKGYAAQRRSLIGETAATYDHGEPLRGGTVYLNAADRDGMMVSMIQSNYLGFGSGIVIPDTGIALHSRASGFSLSPGHLNELAPGKRPYHTIIPGFLTRNGAAIGPFGVMGGHMQPQGHVQMVVNMVDYGMNPQASLDAPRWYWTRGRSVDAEHSTPSHVVRGLQRRGHTIEVAPDPGRFGRGQIIRRLESGVYVAGTEGRTDGTAAGY